MGYSEDPAMVRVDFFKPSGKWYCTEAVAWTGAYHGPSAYVEGLARRGEGRLIHEAFAKSLRDHLGDRLREMDAVCIHPYHQNEHPIMIRSGGWMNYK